MVVGDVTDKNISLGVEDECHRIAFHLPKQGVEEE